MNDNNRRYLIVGPSWIGDMVMAQSLFITLKKQYPDCTIDVIAPQWSLPVLKRMPEVNQGISADVVHGEFSFFHRRKLGMSLKSRDYTHAITLPRSWKSALIPFFAEADIRTGYKGEFRYGLLNDIRKLDKSILKQTVQRYVAHAYEKGIASTPDVPFPALSIDMENQQDVLKRNSLSLDKKIVCMMPGAEYGPAKQWPVSYFKKMASSLVEKGWQVWVLGSEKDAVVGEDIAKSNNDIVNLCGKTQLVDTVDLLACADFAVSNDSGLMHVAAAVGVTVNVIYGSSTPAYTPPLTDHKNIFYVGLECSPCYSRTCRYGHYNCLNEIKPDNVLQRAIE